MWMKGLISIIVLVFIFYLVTCDCPWTKTIRSEKEAIALSYAYLRENCEAIMHCKPEELKIDHIDDLTEMKDKYKWDIWYVDKKNPERGVNILVSEWGERELSFSDGKD